MSKTNRQRLSNFSNLEVRIVLLLLLGVLGIYVLRMCGKSLANEPEQFAWFGDYIGGTIGSISAFVGIIFLYRTYKIQLDIFDCQEKNQQRQQFESTFYSLLERQRDIIINLKGKFPVKNGQSFEEKTSYEYIAQLRRDLEVRLQELDYESDALVNRKENILKIRIDEIYADFFLAHSSQMGHYYRHLYHILKFISSAREIEQKKYFDLVQAQMSSDELYLIAISGISRYGRKKMLPLLDGFAFLENLVIDNDYIMKQLLDAFYPSTKIKDVKLMKKNIIFLGGIHCVGKTTFSREIKKLIPQIETLSCSEVLKWEDSSYKKVKDINDNQSRLIANLVEVIDIDKPYLLDGHFCLLNDDNKIEQVSLDIFRDINPEMIVILVEDLDIILSRLRDRDSREYDRDTIALLASEELKHAQDVAQAIGIPIHILNTSEHKEVIEDIRKFTLTFYSEVSG